MSFTMLFKTSAMKLVVLLCVVSCGLNLVQAGVDKSRAIEILKECKQKTQAKEDVLDIIDSHKLPSSPEGKCMMHCLLETKGLMKGSQVDTNAFSEFFGKAYATEPAQLEAAAKAIAACSVKMNEWKGFDKCEIAARLLQCGHDNNISLS
ncbi:general odorant-binding protein 19d-like [Macrosteles quadrilineatus]|uniref:general odorant-binding protein 19d-like n=1 Tax=Macrosteles quadrilineatus TaxID=74068 RepID=UPI0023E208A8|nr:general odorant-binding protein 19d-like [Macrosteles quadrilineatus]